MATVTHAQSLADSTGGSRTTAAFTPVAGDLLVVFASASDSADTAPTLTNSAGLTFTLITRVDTSDVVITSLYLLVANQSATAVSQTLTFDTPGDANTGSFIFVARVASLTRTGSTAVRQFAVQGITSGIPAPAFASAALTGNPCLGAVTNGLNPATLTPPTGWTEAVDLGYSTPTVGSEYAFINSGFTGTTVTWGSSSASLFGAIVVELDTSAVGGASIPAVTMARHN